MYNHFSVKQPLKNSEAKVYVAMIALALDHLHSRGQKSHTLQLMHSTVTVLPMSYQSAGPQGLFFMI